MKGILAALSVISDLHTCEEPRTRQEDKERVNKDQRTETVRNRRGVQRKPGEGQQMCWLRTEERDMRRGEECRQAEKREVGTLKKGREETEVKENRWHHPAYGGGREVYVRVAMKRVKSEGRATTWLPHTGCVCLNESKIQTLKHLQKTFVSFKSCVHLNSDTVYIQIYYLNKLLQEMLVSSS